MADADDGADSIWFDAGGVSCLAIRPKKIIFIGESCA